VATPERFLMRIFSYQADNSVTNPEKVFDNERIDLELDGSENLENLSAQILNVTGYIN
jgi:hypothetical protein